MGHVADECHLAGLVARGGADIRDAVRAIGADMALVPHVSRENLEPYGQLSAREANTVDEQHALECARRFSSIAD